MTTDCRDGHTWISGKVNASPKPGVPDHCEVCGVIATLRADRILYTFSAAVDPDDIDHLHWVLPRRSYRPRRAGDLAYASVLTIILVIMLAAMMLWSG